MKSPAVDSNTLALDRTVMASERTLMAWVRTSISLIGFGFTIYKFLAGMAEQPGHMPMREPRAIGLIPIGMGLAALLLATIQYILFLRRLGERPRLLPLAFASILWVIGTLAFMNVLTG